MKSVLLAIDVGGSTSRATVVDLAGNCLGQGRNRGGNPGSNPPEQAAAAESAVAEAGEALDIGVALLAIAGPRNAEMLRLMEEAFRRMGLTGPMVLDGDTNAMLPSVTAALEGPRGPEQVRTPWLLGCDGAHSTVRQPRRFGGLPLAE